MKFEIKTDKVSREILDKYLSKISEGSNGCWCFNNVDSWGYGYFTIFGKSVKAHRFMMFLLGREIRHFVVHHNCKRKRCVNPEHLEVLTSGRHATAHRPDCKLRSLSFECKPNPLIDPRVT